MILPPEIIQEISRFCDLKTYTSIICSCASLYRLLQPIQCDFSVQQLSQALRAKKEGLVLKMMQSRQFESEEYITVFMLAEDFSTRRLEALLRMAVKYGLTSVVRRLLNDKRLNTIKARGAYEQLLDSDQYAEIYDLLKETVDRPNYLLHYAVQEHKNAFFDRLMEEDWELESLLDALSSAVNYGNLHCATRLMGRQWTIWQIFESLSQLAKETTFQVFDLILKDRDMTEIDLNPLLKRAATLGMSDIVTLLLDHIPFVKTPTMLLMDCVGFGHFELCRSLLQSNRLKSLDTRWMLLSDFELFETLVETIGFQTLLERHEWRQYSYLVSDRQVLDYMIQREANRHLIMALGSQTTLEMFCYYLDESDATEVNYFALANYCNPQNLEFLLAYAPQDVLCSFEDLAMLAIEADRAWTVRMLMKHCQIPVDHFCDLELVNHVLSHLKDIHLSIYLYITSL
ncbi:hypothetical protein EDD86DRAFT_216036 [Gorgonomyces haynaldii]|nr:hypothetical protein EDD86DRAFT_250196 [Gorgonomyces haynaldii]KAI8915945.1 hypothetical protein EDD86DRAFT_216036 [Gorgonomyces haynaldii]